MNIIKTITEIRELEKLYSPDHFKITQEVLKFKALNGKVDVNEIPVIANEVRANLLRKKKIKELRKELREYMFSKNEAISEIILKRKLDNYNYRNIYVYSIKLPKKRDSFGVRYVDSGRIQSTSKYFYKRRKFFIDFSILKLT